MSNESYTIKLDLYTITTCHSFNISDTCITNGNYKEVKGGNELPIKNLPTANIIQSVAKKPIRLNTNRIPIDAMSGFFLPNILADVQINKKN